MGSHFVMPSLRPTLWATLLLLAACGETATLPPGADIGPNPTLPEPNETLIPTVDIADAIGWPDGGKPVAAEGLAVTALATGLDHPRWLHVLPNGDVLVAETNAPPREEENSGLKGWIAGLILGQAGAAVPSANRISLLRDADGDGVAETRTVFLDSLYSPFGMTLVGEAFYVANSDAIVRFPYRAGDTTITAAGTKVVDLPAGRLNHHWAKNGFQTEEGRAAIWEVDAATGRHRVFASGLRNPVGLAWEPDNGALWVAVNERDELGSDLVPDYMTSVRDGGFYGWPYSYFGRHVDSRPKPPRPDLVATALVPDYALGPHTASLGLAFYEAALLPTSWRGGAFVGQHGSWNRNPRSGYKVIFIPFAGGRPAGPAVDVLTGFL